MAPASECTHYHRLTVKRIMNRMFQGKKTLILFQTGILSEILIDYVYPLSRLMNSRQNCLRQ